MSFSAQLCKYHGLVYSEVDERGYYKFCVLFGMCEPSVKELGVLSNRPVTKFKNASEILRDTLMMLASQNVAV